jgi:hypothetical protein
LGHLPRIGDVRRGASGIESDALGTDEESGFRAVATEARDLDRLVAGDVPMRRGVDGSRTAIVGPLGRDVLRPKCEASSFSCDLWRMAALFVSGPKESGFVLEGPTTTRELP